MTESKLKLFVTGGAKCGKTRFVTELLREQKRVSYFGSWWTSPNDHEAQSILEKVRKQRPQHFITHEPPKDVWEMPTLVKQDQSEFFVFDCFSLWVAKELAQNTTKYSREQLRTHLENQCQELVRLLKSLSCNVVVVSAEVGSGVVVPGWGGRTFRELVGAWNCTLAYESLAAVQMVAGIPVWLKGSHASMNV